MKSLTEALCSNIGGIAVDARNNRALILPDEIGARLVGTNLYGNIDTDETLRSVYKVWSASGFNKVSDLLTIDGRNIVWKRIPYIFLATSNEVRTEEVALAKRLLLNEYCEHVTFWNDELTPKDNYEIIKRCSGLVMVLPKDFANHKTIGKGLYEMAKLQTECYAYYKGRIREIKDLQEIQNPDSWKVYANVSF